MNYYLPFFRTFKALVMLCLVGCVFPMGGGPIDVQQAPVKLQAQQEQQVTFTVKKRHIYTFDLYFEAKDSADRARIASLLGKVYTDRSGRAVREGGVPTPIRLTVQRLERTGAQEVFFSIERDPFPTSFTGRTIGKRIGGTLLTPGQYVATFTAIETVKEFENTQVELVISYNTAFIAP